MKKMVLALTIFVFAFTTNASAQKDPWITQAYKALYNRTPTSIEYNIQNYNGGSWKTYNDLATYIIQYQAGLKAAGCTISCISLGNGKDAAILDINGQHRALDIISQDGGSIVAQGGGNIVAQGGGNIVAQGGGNLQNLPGFKFGPSSTKAGASGAVIKTSGSGAIIIQ